jgi:spore coat protein U-like protein
LLDEQTKNKLNSNIYSTAWRTSPWLRQANTTLDYSDSELDTLIKAGKVKL